jgi:hypothetical protein
MVELSTKMCVNYIYIYARRAEDTAAEDSSVNITADYVIGENCSYIHQNSASFCGGSNLDDCRKCLRPGCTIVECGNESSNRNVRLFE